MRGASLPITGLVASLSARTAWRSSPVATLTDSSRAPQDHTGHYTRLNLLNMYFNMYYPQLGSTEELV